MTSPDNILLHLADDEESQVREIYARLEGQGFPALQQTPHITVTFATRMPGDVVKRAAELLPALIPASFQRVGTVVFGTGRKQTVAWLLETTDELEIAARELNALNPDGRGPRWTPHLTMGLRLPRNLVPGYIRALDEVSFPTELRATRAALWRPRERELTVLAGEGYDSREMRLTGELVCRTPDEVEVVERHLPRHIELTRAEPGCLECEVWPVVGQPVWTVRERFIDGAAFGAHQRRVAGSEWGRVTAGIERRYTVEQSGRFRRQA